MNFLKMPLRPGFDRVNGVYYAFDRGDFPVFAIDPGACGMTMDEAEVVTNEIVQAVNYNDRMRTVCERLVAGMDEPLVQGLTEAAKLACVLLVEMDQKSDDATT